jgi:hypothetical protein
MVDLYTRLHTYASTESLILSGSNENGRVLQRKTVGDPHVAAAQSLPALRLGATSAARAPAAARRLDGN